MGQGLRRRQAAVDEAALPEPMPPPLPKTGAQLFERTDDGEWDEMGMFDSDDLDEERVFVLLALDDVSISSHGTCFVWVGAEGGGAAKARQLGSQFAQQKDLSDDMPIEVVESGSEPPTFWAHFVNG